MHDVASISVRSSATNGSRWRPSPSSALAPPGRASRRLRRAGEVVRRARRAGRADVRLELGEHVDAHVQDLVEPGEDLVVGMRAGRGSHEACAGVAQPTAPLPSSETSESAQACVATGLRRCRRRQTCRATGRPADDQGARRERRRRGLLRRGEGDAERTENIGRREEHAREHRQVQHDGEVGLRVARAPADLRPALTKVEHAGAQQKLRPVTRHLPQHRLERLRDELRRLGLDVAGDSSEERGEREAPPCACTKSAPPVRTYASTMNMAGRRNQSLARASWRCSEERRELRRKADDGRAPQHGLPQLEPVLHQVNRPGASGVGRHREQRSTLPISAATASFDPTATTLVTTDSTALCSRSARRSSPTAPVAADDRLDDC